MTIGILIFLLPRLQPLIKSVKPLLAFFISGIVLLVIVDSMLSLILPLDLSGKVVETYMLLKEKFSSVITMAFVILFAHLVYIYEHYGTLSSLLKDKVQDQNAIILAALNTSHIPMIIKDRDLVIIAANKAFCKIAGVDQSQLIGKTLDDVKGLTKNKEVIARIDLHKSKDKILLQDEEVKIIKYQDNDLFFIKECVCLKGRVIGIVTQIVDRSNENQLEQTLAESTEGIAAIKRLLEILK